MIRHISFFLFLISLSPFAGARMIQIIHTNDLHSYFEGYNGSGAGGYARVLTKINELRAEAAAKGIEVLQLDAGDWGEGTMFYLADDGADSLKALEMLGVEVATIGNHDNLLGTDNLARQLRKANIKTKFTLANLDTKTEMGDVVTPYVDVDRAGIKIRVIGLTTDENYFQYAVSPGNVLAPVPVGEAEAKRAKSAGRELVIALTHLGQSKDDVLANNSTEIDVIIGGHTHTKLETVDWEKNLNGKQVPIVQAWAHGLAVGSLLLDVDETGNTKVVDYKLHKVDDSVTPDAGMLQFIAQSVPKKNDHLDHPWDEVIGETKTPISGYIGGKPVIRSSCWGHHMAKAARLATGAALGIHISQFEGMSKPAGPVTYGDIANSYPHIRKYGDQGWQIATVTMAATKLRVLLWWISRHGYGVSISGLGYKDMPDENDKGVYRIAIPAEVALAIKTSMPGYGGYLQGLRYTDKYYWPVMTEYIRKNTPLSCN